MWPEKEVQFMLYVVEGSFLSDSKQYTSVCCDQCSISSKDAGVLWLIADVMWVAVKEWDGNAELAC